MNSDYYTCSCVYGTFSCKHDERSDTGASDADDEDDSVAIVAGTVAGLLVFIAIVAGLAAYFISNKRRQAKSELSGNVTQTTMSNVQVQPTTSFTVSAVSEPSRISVANSVTPMPVTSVAWGHVKPQVANV